MQITLILYTLLHVNHHDTFFTLKLNNVYTYIHSVGFGIYIII